MRPCMLTVGLSMPWRGMMPDLMNDALLQAVEQRDEIHAALEALDAGLRRAGTPCKCLLGFQGGYEEAEVYWHENLGLWSLLDMQRISNRSWCCFGTTKPTAGAMMPITCEINCPFEGINRRIAGVVARDDGGRVYLAHTGKVGGGRAGIGKNAFWTFYGDKGVQTVAWSDERKAPVILLGRIDGPHLLAGIAGFVRQVEHFKSLAAAGTLADGAVGLRPDFRPEFSGRRRKYTLSGGVEARCDHGVVVNHLYDLLAAADYKVSNGRADLYVVQNNTITHLFEAKSDTTTTSIYQGIGQLMFYGAAMASTPRRILVLPDQPNELTQDVLRRLGVSALVFDWEDGVPTFPSIDEVMK
jgi:hypothetical protein